MSHIGKLSRGLKWFSLRTANGLPAAVEGDPEKMVDVEYFLNHVKNKDANKIATWLIELRDLERTPNVKGRGERIAELKDKIGPAPKPKAEEAKK